MWRWILGGLAVLALVLLGTCYFGFKKITAGGDTVTTTVAGTPERVFALLATPDSMSTWVASGKVMSPLGRGLLAAGDTLMMDDPGRSVGSAKQNVDWLVREVRAPYLLVLEMRQDSAGQGMRPILTRRDSLVAMGDSTRIISTFSAPLMDSMATVVRDSSRMGGAIANGAGKFVVGAMRLVHESDLSRLKAHAEGKAVP